MMEMEPFPFFQEDATGMPSSSSSSSAAAAATEDVFSWDFRGLSVDLVSPILGASPLPSEEDMLLWGIPPPGEYATSLGPLPLAVGGELLHWATSPMVQPATPAPPLVDQPPLPPVVRRSAFVQYERASCYGKRRQPGAGGGEGENIHRRVMEYLRKIPEEKKEKKAAESSRCFRHMMRERERRERLSKNYSDLHSMIVPRPKPNKNAIVLSAAAYVRELKGRMEALQKRHQELRASLGEAGARPEAATIKLRVGNPSSPLDSMITALRQLKGMDVTVQSIRSCTGDRELSAVIGIETKMARKEVEKAVQEAVVETERKLRSGFPRPNVDPDTNLPLVW